MTPTPPSGIPAQIADQVHHDAAQDTALDRLRLAVVTVGLLALAALCTAAVSLVHRGAPSPSRPLAPPVVHCPAAPAATCAPSLTCAACPACPAPRSHRR